SNFVTVSLSSGTGPLQGTTALDIGTGAGNGTATYTNLRIDAAGTKQLTATAAGLLPAVSNTFTISASTTPSQLAFGVQPSTTTAGAAINPAVTVLVEDQFGNVITGDNATTVTVTSNPGSFNGSSTTSMLDANGVATFNNLRIDTAGSYTIT